MKKKYNNKETLDETYEIDYDLFTVEEIIKIIQFYQLMGQYKNIINNLSLEKRYNENFYQKTGISIYQTIKSIE